MPKINPLVWPKRPSFDRTVYRPGKRAHLVEYQQEKIDITGTPYWDVLDCKAIDKTCSVHVLSKCMVKFYNQKHGGYLCNA